MSGRRGVLVGAMMAATGVAGVGSALAGGARPGYIIGSAKTECGRAVGAFTVSAYGFDGNVNVNPGGLPFLGSVRAHGGRYALRTRDSVRQRRPVNALVRGVSAVAVVRAPGGRYTLSLDPTDHKRDGTGTSDFRGLSGKGIVRNFVLRTSGMRPGEDAYRGRETEGDDSAAGSFYGGNLILSLGFYPSPGQTLTATLTPTSRLIDGCAARTVVRTANVGAMNTSDVYLHSIPLANYVLTVRLNGVLLPLHRIAEPSPGTRLPISFPPTPELPDGGSAVTVDVG